tara:strand:+ start:2599 stop:3171 length:573 start_codon:yes stop_codon:yes gene_type:complete
VKNRPKLNTTIKVDDFKSFYWLKKELILFCKHLKIPTQGSKIELIARIEHFLSCGQILDCQPKVGHAFRDSDNGITASTPVINYRNDAQTRAFFVSHIGEQFKFNDYLRSFARKENDGSLSYGDLVQGYKDSLKHKKITIDKQFEYNQFQRDFFKHNPKGKREDCLKAWQLIKSVQGQPTYLEYVRKFQQ